MLQTKAIIVDDESSARRVLRTLLKSHEKISIIAECDNLRSAATKIKELNPDVVFLDVNMPDLLGHQIVDFFPNYEFEIIFVTAYDNYAINAFDISALDYLLKPINRQRLKASLDRLNQKLTEKHSLKKIDSKQFKIIIPELGDRTVLDSNEIIAIEAKGAYAKIYRINDKTIMVSKNLRYFESKLKVSESFFRSHRSWIINLEHLKFCNKTKGNLILINDVIAKISRSRLAEISENK